MGIEIDNRKINNSNATYQNIEKVINGDETNIYNTTVFQINMNESYELLTNKVNYNEFYKKYLNKFDELDNYAYHLTFPYFNLAINSSVNYLLPGLIPRGSAS